MNRLERTINKVLKMLYKVSPLLSHEDAISVMDAVASTLLGDNTTSNLYRVDWFNVNNTPYIMIFDSASPFSNISTNSNLFHLLQGAIIKGNKDILHIKLGVYDGRIHIALSDYTPEYTMDLVYSPEHNRAYITNENILKKLIDKYGPDIEGYWQFEYDPNTRSMAGTKITGGNGGDNEHETLHS